MTNSNSELKDWASLYRPLGKYLLASYRHLLQVKMNHTANLIAPPLVDSKSSGDLPLLMAVNALQRLPATSAALSLTKVDFKDPHVLQVLAQVQDRSLYTQQGKGSEFYDHVKKVLYEHYHEV